MVAYVTTDLGPGDGGKGSIVHKLATMLDASIVIKTGGAQGSHGICTSKGERVAFSQWGCGTVEGIKTHISSDFIVYPEGLINEANALRYQFGIDAFDLLTVDENALCATPYHRIISRLKELSRKNNPRGTVGTGVGESFRYSNNFPKLSITVKDLSDKDLIRQRLTELRQKISVDIYPIITGGILEADLKEAVDEADMLFDDNFQDYIIDKFYEVSRIAHIVTDRFLKKEVFFQKRDVVVERSHGVLTDSVYGLCPHTSAIRTLPYVAKNMLEKYGFDDKIINIGVTRAYQFRHGAGPVTTEDPSMMEKLLSGSHKPENRYQGKARCGPIDFNLLRYAIDVCGGPSAFDGLAITWFDQIIENGKFSMCGSYEGNLNPIFFADDGRVRLYKTGMEVDQKCYQEALTKELFSCKPNINMFEFSENLNPEEMFNFCDCLFAQKTGVPVKIVSYGPDDGSKICKL